MQARKRESPSIDTVSGAEFYPVARFELLPATGNQIGRRRASGENERPGEVDTSVSDLPRKMCSRSLAKAPSPRSDVQGRDLAMVTEIVRNPCSFALFSQERCLALLERLCTCPRASSCSCLRGPFARCDLPLPCRIHPAGYPCAGQAWPGHPVRVRSVCVAYHTLPQARLEARSLGQGEGWGTLFTPSQCFSRISAESLSNAKARVASAGNWNRTLGRSARRER